MTSPEDRLELEKPWGLSCVPKFRSLADEVVAKETEKK